MNLTQLLAQFIKLGRKWIWQQRMAYREAGHPLPDEAVQKFSHYFDAELLDRVRIVRVPAIENPPFLGQFRAVMSLARVPVLDFSSMAALTLVDTILLAESAARNDSDALLFHELVHVVQYDILGLDSFVELFLTGWVNQGFNYAAIPLEMDAYELQNQYEVSPGEAFEVREEVSTRLELLVED